MIIMILMMMTGIAARYGWTFRIAAVCAVLIGILIGRLTGPSSSDGKGNTDIRVPHMICDWLAPSFRHKYPGSLTFGEMRRAAFALHGPGTVLLCRDGSGYIRREGEVCRSYFYDEIQLRKLLPSLGIISSDSFRDAPRWQGT